MSSKELAMNVQKQINRMGIALPKLRPKFLLLRKTGTRSAKKAGMQASILNSCSIATKRFTIIPSYP
jgi:hypothetical protein